MGLRQSKKKSVKSLKEIENETKYINCNGNLTDLCQLSHQIIVINCSYNKIQTISNLPKELKIFFCYSNRLTKINNLPHHIKIFVGCYNNISKIENLPTSLQELQIRGNPIEKLTKKNVIKRKLLNLQTIVLNYILDQA